MANYETRKRLIEETVRVGREWIVVSVPGDDGRGDPTVWFAANRFSRRSSRAFDTYDEALVEAQRRNGLR